MEINLGNVIPISTVDWYRKSACVVFFSGCNFTCPYCQNYKLLSHKNIVNIQTVEKQIFDAGMFISSVVFSGGEATLQYDALKRLAKFSKGLGLCVGIQTNGSNPTHLKELIKQKNLDKIFLDIKADPRNTKKYDNIVSYEGALSNVLQTLSITDIPIETKTTIFKSLNDSLEIAKYLVDIGFKQTYVIQQGVLVDNISQNELFTADEIKELAIDIKNKTKIQNIKIRTKERGEEQIQW